MTLPTAALEVWARAISNHLMERTGATRHRIPGWSCTVDLDDFSRVDWPDCGFTEYKLRYLRRKYPPNDLPETGCIETLSPIGFNPDGIGLVTYRRVDVTRGWLADVLYLRSLGWRGSCRFLCTTDDAMLHAVNASAVAPAVYAAGLWRGAAPILARTLRRAVVHRMQRRHETRAATRRVNDWAHRIATVEAMAETITKLDAEGGHRRTQERMFDAASDAGDLHGPDERDG